MPSFGQKWDDHIWRGVSNFECPSQRPKKFLRPSSFGYWSSSINRSWKGGGLACLSGAGRAGKHPHPPMWQKGLRLLLWLSPPKNEGGKDAQKKESCNHTIYLSYLLQSCKHSPSPNIRQQVKFVMIYLPILNPLKKFKMIDLQLFPALTPVLEKAQSSNGT